MESVWYDLIRNVHLIYKPKLQSGLHSEVTVDSVSENKLDPGYLSLIFSQAEVS